ncbi:hypothetical protein Q3G72_005233 [Acer saccharum]|nr:hypothetical protein Q3G72_005233 [Acer saccharum]
MKNVHNSSNPSTMNKEKNKETADETEERLFKNAMKSEWAQVVQIYRDNLWIHKAKITRSGGTALHIAVSDGREEIVEELVNIIKASAQEVLGIGDEIGNTPLHTAATLGNVKMCKCIAEVDKKLIGARNKDSETPFFMAASHGHKLTFLCLHSLCEPGKGYDYSRRNDGETILHCAISGDYFDLAFQIIHHYEELVNKVNERGISPLHLLATKPSAFRSGSHLGRWNEFIYHLMHRALDCMFDNQGKPLASEAEDRPTQRSFDNEGNPMPISDAENPCEGANQHEQKDANGAQNKNLTGEGDDVSNSKFKAQGHQLFPPNYSVCFELVKLVSKAILVILGLGSNKIRKIREKKQNNTWSIQVMNELLKRASMYRYENDGKKPVQQQSQPGVEDAFLDMPPITEDASEMSPIPPTSNVSGANQHQQKAAEGPQDKNQTENKEETSEMEKKESPVLKALHDYMNYQKKNVVLLAMENRQPHEYQLLVKMNENKKEISEMEKIESPILIAAKNGITEIVEKILENFPVALHDMNYEKKNVVLLAVENRQPHVYELLIKKTNRKESVFRKVDHEGNSALHLAARLGDHKPWLIPGAALQMQWEIKWYEYVKGSMPFHFFVRYNKASKSPRDVFTETHKDLVKSGGDWLTNTSQSCSVVAALIATVAFATSSTVPGGVRYQERDFGSNLPRKLLVGLTSLFVAIASMLVSFCSGHFFVLKEQLKFAAVPVYAVTCLPITFFAIAQFPLYFDLIWAAFKKVPQRSYKSIPV